MLVVALIGLPLTIFFSNQKQTLKTEASGATTILSLIPQPGPSSSIQKNVGDAVPIDLMVNPGTNAVSVLRVQVKYDPTKLEPATANQFTPAGNFSFVQAPVFSNGLLSFVISIGTDPNRAIFQPAKAGTFHFKAIEGTNDSQTIVSFTNQTQTFSLGAGDQASENVLSGTNPAHIIINDTPAQEQPTSTPTPSPSPTPTRTPTPTKTPTPVPSISSAPTGPSSLSLTVLLHSIGNSGDNVNPTLHSLSNKSPKQQQRIFTISLYNADTAQLVASHTGTLSYNTAQGNFQGTVELNDNLAEGDYMIKVKTDNFLQRKVPGFIYLSPNKQTTLPTITLVAGDANGDNKINLLDYNFLVGCYSDFLPPTDCNDTKKGQTDFNDDDLVNQTDINLFLREITVQNGD